MTTVPAHTRTAEAIRRVTDLGAALVILVGLSWLLIAIWLLVRLTSRGPGLFAQVRVGRQQAPFTCYKFRTMRTGTPHAATHEIPPDATTRLGRFLRRTKLDELPQAWNLLRGEMTLVGPRPCLPVQHALIAERQRRGVFALKPGLTGLAQIRNVDMRDPVRLARLDAQYQLARSCSGDVQILWRTFFRSA